MPSELLGLEGAAALLVDAAAAALASTYARDQMPGDVAPMAVLDIGGL